MMDALAAKIKLLYNLSLTNGIDEFYNSSLSEERIK
jgi:hypothetical protein